MANLISWPQEAIYSLLEKVRDREVLWNIKHKDYPKKNLRRGLFGEVSRELKEEFPSMEDLTPGVHPHHSLRNPQQLYLPRSHPVTQKICPYPAALKGFRRAQGNGSFLMQTPYDTLLDTLHTVKSRVQKQDDFVTTSVRGIMQYIPESCTKIKQSFTEQVLKLIHEKTIEIHRETANQ
ncbi:hypothetical protein Pmani_023615 [Petrolisthes manimaculis]|uniref:MADF domain-containing protein n=1 Tax=Petrolisthes manimaculis TaxID=1843537 RepID=A0AAE1TZG1_9EUCA|nr:hypothetical protein Pmani_023615 [Petrolisthes manimaculis]